MPPLSPEKSGAEHGTLGSCRSNSRSPSSLIFGLFIFYVLLNKCLTDSPVSCPQADIICNKVSSLSKNAIFRCFMSCLITTVTLISPGQGNGTTEKWLQHSWSVSGMLMRCCLCFQSQAIPSLWVPNTSQILSTVAWCCYIPLLHHLSKKTKKIHNTYLLQLHAYIYKHFSFGFHRQILSLYYSSFCLA